MASELGPGDVLVLENSRFEPGESSNDPELAAALARMADVYVNDAFGAAHRAHATTEGVARLLPAAAGFLLEREVTLLDALVADPERPFVVVLGGAKVTDKIGVIERFLEIANAILIGGAMCFSFFRAMGHETGDSLVEEEGVDLARQALEHAETSLCSLELPQDLVIADRFDADARSRVVDGRDVPEGWMGLDIGPRTAQRIRAPGGGRRDRVLERPDGSLRDGALCRGHPRGGRGDGGLQRNDCGRWGRLRRGAGRVRPRRFDNARVDWRWRLARVARGDAAAGSGGAR